MNDRVRIGDAEREAAAHELGEHFAMGRISAEEHAERLEQIWAARTQAELTPVFGDLPRPRQPEPPKSAKSRARSRVPQAPRAPHVPFLFKALVAIVAVYFLWSHPLLLFIALLVYVLVVRRVMHRGRWHDHHAHWR
jgi:Flp pilus assembly protein TadB